jgi:hypothetical protein
MSQKTPILNKIRIGINLLREEDDALGIVLRHVIIHVLLILWTELYFQQLWRPVLRRYTIIVRYIFFGVQWQPAAWSLLEGDWVSSAALKQFLKLKCGSILWRCSSYSGTAPRCPHQNSTSTEDRES